MFVAKLPINSDASTPTVAIKDNIDVAGLVSGMGSAAFVDIDCAVDHADVVKGMVAAGWQLAGKLMMHELAFGMTGVNSFSGTPHNPLYPDLIPGGSSSGCATAVAAGLVDVAIGTDTGGSIRLPAACCGVVGFKPSFERVSRQGVKPEQSTLDCVGPMARRVELIEQAMQAMEATFTPVTEPAQCTLGLIDFSSLPTSLSPDVEDMMQQAVAHISQLNGLSINSISLPNMGAAMQAGITLIAYEMHQTFGDLPVQQLGEDIAMRLSAAASITSQQVQQAKTIQAAFTHEVSQALQSCDALLLPTLPSTPLSLQAAQQGASDLNSSALVRPFNVSGHPAISVPMAQTQPFSVQLVGALGQDERLCAVAKCVERALPTPHYPTN